MKKRAFTITKVLLTVMLALSLSGLASYTIGIARDRNRFEEMKAELDRVPDTDQNTEYSQHTEYLPVKKSKTQMYQADVQASTNSDLIKSKNFELFAPLVSRNSDCVGWIRIPDTAIDYPVMYSPYEPDFYLYHDFDKNDSNSGVPYIGKDCSIYCDNIIIYAHNMKNGTMFGGLLKYSDPAYCQKHPEIEFVTLEEDEIYDIIAVFRERVHYKDETDVFRYYNYCGELSKEEYEYYINTIKSISLYDTGKTAVYGQKLITLSTCSYHTENGRFVVVAAKR